VRQRINSTINAIVRLEISAHHHHVHIEHYRYQQQ
jgi:hypothetical protein